MLVSLEWGIQLYDYILEKNLDTFMWKKLFENHSVGVYHYSGNSSYILKEMKFLRLVAQIF